MLSLAPGPGGRFFTKKKYPVRGITALYAGSVDHVIQ